MMQGMGLELSRAAKRLRGKAKRVEVPASARAGQRDQLASDRRLPSLSLLPTHTQAGELGGLCDSDGEGGAEAGEGGEEGEAAAAPPARPRRRRAEPPPPGPASYLVCCVEEAAQPGSGPPGQVEVGLVAVEPSTGAVLHTQFRWARGATCSGGVGAGGQMLRPTASGALVQGVGAVSCPAKAHAGIKSARGGRWRAAAAHLRPRCRPAGAPGPTAPVFSPPRCRDGLLRQELESRLLFAAPAEILIAQPASSETRRLAAAIGEQLGAPPRLETAAAAKYKLPGTAADAVRAFYGGAGGSGEGSAAAEAVAGLPPLVLRALAHLLDHLRPFGLEGVLRLGAAFQPWDQAQEMRLSANTLRWGGRGASPSSRASRCPVMPCWLRWPPPAASTLLRCSPPPALLPPAVRQAAGGVPQLRGRAPGQPGGGDGPHQGGLARVGGGGGWKGGRGGERRRVFVGRGVKGRPLCRRHFLAHRQRLPIGRPFSASRSRPPRRPSLGAA
jgi:hypothetical protein